MAPDRERERLMRRYAPRLIERAHRIAAPEQIEAAEAAPVAEAVAGTETRDDIDSSSTDSSDTDSSSTDSTTAPWTPFATLTRNSIVLTAPATVERAAMWDTVPNPNPHMLWMQGRFVGAEVPNKNGALWAVSDLAMGQATVAHGPLNWLHEDRHVIGVIADARMVPSRTQAVPVPQAAADGAGSLQKTVREAHITALSGIWRWLYPDEASIVEMASSANTLAYSMECIAESVECAGEKGCGRSYPYAEYAQGNACDHLHDRSSIRRLVNPTFLGGAVIVPPTRPGWADADASVVARAVAMAEKAFEDAGRPDIPASTWEAMMTQVVAFGDAP